MINKLNGIKRRIHKFLLSFSPDKVLLVDGLNTGKGVIALRDFKRGATILEFKGKLITSEQLPDLHDKESDFYLQIGPNLYIGPSCEVDDYVNHSCRPNCKVEISGTRAYLVALHPILVGEEVTFDYSSTMYNDPWTMVCKCGYPECRKIVKSPNL
jgi:SET domain-containing protein